MLGAEKQVIGLSANVYHMPVYPYYASMDSRIRSRQLPTPGNWDFVNIEMVVGLQPDLVVIWSHQQESIAALEEKGVPVYGVYIEQLDDIYKELDDLGRLTGKEERAKDVIGFAKQELAEIRKGIRQMPKDERTSVYYMWAQGELETAGENSMVQELIQLSGARNVAGHVRQEHLVVNMENVLSWDPQVIVMWYNERKNPEDISRKAMWGSVSAVKNGRVHEFPDAFTCDLWTLKYIHAVSLVAEWCYPEHFDETDGSIDKWALFEKLYGRPFDSDAIQDLQQRR